MFVLNERLRLDTAEVLALDLCLVLLMNDKTFPWLILVPRTQGMREIHDLSKADRALLMEEIAIASKVIEGLYKPDKINVGVLGNIVPQLHAHVIGRRKDDRAWPGPAWGSGPAVPYTAGELKAELKSLRAAFEMKRW